MSRFASRLLVAMVCLLPFLSAEAITRTWVGPNHVSWSDPSNWSPSGVPADGDDLVLSYTGLGLLTTNNDLPPGLVLKTLTLSATDMQGNSLTVTGDLSLSGGHPIIFDAPVTLGSSIHVFGGSDLVFSDIDVNGKTLDLDGGAYFKVLDGSGTINAMSGSLLTIDGGSFHGTINGNADVRGALADADFTGSSPTDPDYPTLAGFGSVGNVAVADLYPGYMPFTGDPHTVGTLHAKSLTVLNHFGVDLSSTGYDSMAVTGSVTISSQLTLSTPTGDPSFAPPLVGQNFVIIDNQGTQPVNGRFENLPEGAVLQLGNLFYRITYAGGDGNDVELLSATQPDAVAFQNAAATVIGEPLTVSVSLTSQYGTPAGSVTFTDNGAVLGTRTLANGVASMEVTLAAIGAHSIAASYAGAGAFVGVDSSPLTHTVNKGMTSTVWSPATPAAMVYGDAPILITASALAPATGLVEGQVTLLEGATPVGNNMLDGGAATVSPVLTPGTHTLTASYAGSATFLGSQSVSTTVTIGPGPTQLVVSKDDSAPADAVSLKIFVKTVYAVPSVPTGMLTITERGSVLAQVGTPGDATVKLQLPAGHHTLLISYSGDDNFAGDSAEFDVDVTGTVPSRRRSVRH